MSAPSAKRLIGWEAGNESVVEPARANALIGFESAAKFALPGWSASDRSTRIAECWEVRGARVGRRVAIISRATAAIVTT